MIYKFEYFPRIFKCCCNSFPASGGADGLPNEPIFVGLIWQYAMLNDKLGCLRLSEPGLGTPMPVWLNGRLISQDLALAALDINVMARVVPLSNVDSVLEIGAGYGKLAYIFTSLFPRADYTIADIAPALAVSQNYLPAVTSGKNLRFVLPHELDKLPDKHFDLIINVSSLDEMPPPVQGRYLKRINRLCRGHLYLAGYGKHLGERVGLNDLSYDPRWVALYDQAHEVFPLWVEKVFAIPTGPAIGGQAAHDGDTHYS